MIDPACHVVNPANAGQSGSSWRSLRQPRSGGGRAERFGLVGKVGELGVRAVVLQPGDDLRVAVAPGVARGGSQTMTRRGLPGPAT